MSTFDDEFGEEGGFGDWLSGLRPGHKVSGARLLRYRQGSDPRDWSAAGGAKYLPRDWQMQCGTQKWTGAAAVAGALQVTFPVAFADPPVFLATCLNTTPLFQRIQFQCPTQSAGAQEIYWWAAAALTRVDFCWLALGPIGM